MLVLMLKPGILWKDAAQSGQADTVAVVSLDSRCRHAAEEAREVAGSIACSWTTHPVMAALLQRRCCNHRSSILAQYRHRRACMRLAVELHLVAVLHDTCIPLSRRRQAGSLLPAPPAGRASPQDNVVLQCTSSRRSKLLHNALQATVRRLKRRKASRATSTESLQPPAA